MPAEARARHGRTRVAPDTAHRRSNHGDDDIDHDIENDTAHRPRMSADHLAAIRSWHEYAYHAALDAADTTRQVDYLGLDLLVPPNVAGPTMVAHLLGDIVVAESRPGMRVLDMGTGCGANAILAAARGAHVVAVDISPAAATATRINAERNGVADCVDVRVSDLFDAVPERFDLIVFDPPLRWFHPRDALDATMTDEDYVALERFLRTAGDHLTPTGCLLVFFGSAGDIAYLRELLDGFAYETEVVALGRLFLDGHGFDYLTYRAFPTRPSPPPTAERTAIDDGPTDDGSAVDTEDQPT